MRSRTGGSWSGRGSRRSRPPTARLGGADLIRRALELVNAAADDAGDEEVTPSDVAEVIRDALESEDPGLREAKVRGYLVEALDAVSDGMPADYTAMFLYAALGAFKDR